MTYPVKTAHYYASSKRKFVVIVEAGQPFSTGIEINISGKALARKLAATMGAKCWNF